MGDPSEPEVRVVDRRWWAQSDAATASAESDDRRAQKPTYVEELEQRLADAMAQLQAYLTEHRRALDEFEQAKARIRRDVGREVERAKRTVLVELLDVVDNLDRALGAAPDDESPLPRGVRLVRDQFLAKLEAFGVTRVAALGRPFDSSVHEAIATAPANAEQDGHVIAVVKEGYAIGDEVLRPAAVVVGSRS